MNKREALEPSAWVLGVLLTALVWRASPLMGVLCLLGLGIIMGVELWNRSPE